MNLKSLTIGMVVNHPNYGNGTVKSLNEHLAEIRFQDGVKTVDPSLCQLTPAEPYASLTELSVPLSTIIEQTAQRVIDELPKALGVKMDLPVVTELGVRWHGGKAVLHPADPTLQTKEVPLEVFFHKIVGVRNQLRVLEQKVNAHPALTDGDKVEMQQYISRCYGSLTTFNLLFKDKEGQFSSKGS